MLEHNYFSFLFSSIQNVDQFTCSEQKAPDKNKGHSSLQNCGSSVWTSFMLWYREFWKFVDPT